MNNLFLLITIYLTFFSLLQTTLPGMYRAIWTKAFLGLCVFLMFLHCDDRMDYRNSDRDPYYRDASVVIHMYDIEDYLDEIGVDRTSRVFCTPDNSINISLYYCNRKGVTDYSSFRSLSLEERLEKLKERQIEYVILGSREPYADVENLDQLLGQRIGHIRDTEIFKLEP
jgi:hypothetical protein